MNLSERRERASAVDEILIMYASSRGIHPGAATSEFLTAMMHLCDLKDRAGDFSQQLGFALTQFVRERGGE